MLIKNLLEDLGNDQTESKIRIPLLNVSSSTLENVVYYLTNQNFEDNNLEFNRGFLAELDTLVFVLNAAHYMMVDKLTELCCSELALTLSNMTNDEIYHEFNIIDDRTPVNELSDDSSNHFILFYNGIIPYDCCEKMTSLKTECVVGSIITEIDNFRFFEGIMGTKETPVKLVRLPNYPRFSNCIGVLNFNEEVVGHIQKKLALLLSPLIDLKRIRLEGNCPKATKNKNKGPPLVLKIYGLLANQHMLVQMLSEEGFNTLPEELPYSEIEIDGGLQESAAIPYFSLDELSSVVDLSNLPAHAPPPLDTIATPLYNHQLQSLQWCISRERPELPISRSSRPVQFWEKRTGRFIKTRR